MPKQVLWSPLAEQDLDSTLVYLSQNWDQKVVVRFLDEIDDIVGQISRNPKQFPLIQKRLKIRKCVITMHNSLYYREGKNQIDILRIYDNRQDPRKLKFI